MSVGRFAARSTGPLRGSCAVVVVGVALLFAGCLIPRKPTECSTDEDCRDKYDGRSYCADDGVCESYTKKEYLAEPCNFDTTGPVLESGTRRIGVILKMSEPDSDELIEPVKRAIDLAINDINTKGGVRGHKFAAIYCDNEGKNKKALDAARHLAKIGVEAVVGPGFSSHTLEVAPEVLIPNDMMAISPSATSTQISALDDKDLIWRTVPSDETQTRALAKLVKRLKAEKEDGNFGGVASGEKAKLGMSTRKNDAYAEGLRNGVVKRLDSSLVENDQLFFKDTHPNPSRTSGNPDYSDIALTIKQENPDIMMLWGIDEIWPVVRNAHRAGSDSSALDETIYVTADGGKKLSGAKKTAMQTKSLGGRIWGTAPGTPNPDDESNNAYKLFSFRWQGETQFGAADQNAFIAYGYDAVYLFAFAYAASGTFEGPKLAAAMDKVTDPKGPTVQANQSDIVKGINALENGNSIRFLGATGPIEFNDKGDPKTANIELWCYRDASDSDETIVEVGNLLQAGSSKFRFKKCEFPDETGMN